ncbi:MAG: AsmA-like C-terminal region-containing protein, partial [Burkholderiaceae bacterium]
PPPLNKAATESMPLKYENVFVATPAGAPLQDQLTLQLGQLVNVNYVRELGGAEPRVLRGAIALGLQGEALPLPDQGVAAKVSLGVTNLDAWEQVLEGGLTPATTPARPAGAGAASAEASQSYLPTRIDLRAREITVEGRALHNLSLQGTRNGAVWRGTVDSTELAGLLEYRQPVGAGAGLVYARLSRLSIAAAQASAVETLLDEQPGSIPALDIVVEDFELKGRKLGKLEIEATNRGGAAATSVREWRLNKLALTMPEAKFNATGNWAAIDAQATPAGMPRPARAAPERRRTVMNFKLDIGDAGQLLTRLGMKDVVRAGKGRMEGQVAWLGSPLGLDYPSMQGNFHVDVASGQFLKADPGLAKLLGVLSLQSLPRRLTLDFRDVFSQGFPFDFLRGDVTIQQGVAATNNLQMKGVNAAVLMEGKADLARETQDLRVVVVPEITAGTAALVATAINPVVGLGTFIAQWLLSRPLSAAATQEFQIEGTWVDPKITRVPRRALSAGDAPKERTP